MVDLIQDFRDQGLHPESDPVISSKGGELQDLFRAETEIKIIDDWHGLICKQLRGCPEYRSRDGLIH